MRKLFQIWAEGYNMTGQSSGAYLLGTAEGNDFADACNHLSAVDGEFLTYYNPKTMSYFGCKLFDNEADARRSFG